MMRRTASEVIRDLQVRIARLERKAAPVGATRDPLKSNPYVYHAPGKVIFVVAEVPHGEELVLVLDDRVIFNTLLYLHRGLKVEIDATGDDAASMSASSLKRAMVQRAENNYAAKCQAFDQQNARTQKRIDELMLKGRGRILKKDTSAYVLLRDFIISPRDYEKEYELSVAPLKNATFTKSGSVFTLNP